MEDNIFDRLESLMINTNQVDISLLYEEELLKSLSLEKDRSISIKGKLEDLEKLCKKVSILRDEINKIILNIKQQHIQETNAEIGILYAYKHKNLLFKMLQVLKDIAKENNINIICFNIRDINIESQWVKGIFISNNDIKDATSKIPPFIYNMGYYTKVENIRKVKELRIKQKFHTVNPLNRFNQYIIFDMISALYKESPILLPYTMFTKPNLYNYLEKYNSIYLFPEKKTSNRQIIVVNKRDKNYNLYVGVSKYTCMEKDLYDDLLKITKNRKYFIMKAAKAITINNIPLETRIYVQKGNNSNWEVTEMIAKCQWFYEGSIYKDSCYHLGEVLYMLIPEKSRIVESRLKGDAIKICLYLENYLNNMGSYVLDFIITEEGDHCLIYIGGWEDNDFLLKLEDQNSWKKYFKNALEYLITLRNNKVIYDD